ncbi:MAG: hypothetical protein Sylvanvirus30_9 [Sylvanvirus sp.]|uniref:Uncharacterized protein n=1 Tax=Sylvanvirus sp. TaxID=2487774 RepID=A0A3G5AJ01_9VIRU|nr:MAG: hypothetical protein Sylvanvirus30_9 [Sylvanvirus sp.]
MYSIFNVSKIFIKQMSSTSPIVINTPGLHDFQGKELIHDIMGPLIDIQAHHVEVKNLTIRTRRPVNFDVNQMYHGYHQIGILMIGGCTTENEKTKLTDISWIQEYRDKDVKTTQLVSVESCADDFNYISFLNKVNLLNVQFKLDPSCDRAAFISIFKFSLLEIIDSNLGFTCNPLNSDHVEKLKEREYIKSMDPSSPFIPTALEIQQVMKYTSQTQEMASLALIKHKNFVGAVLELGFLLSDEIS